MGRYVLSATALLGALASGAALGGEGFTVSVCYKEIPTSSCSPLELEYHSPVLVGPVPSETSRSGERTSDAFVFRDVPPGNYIVRESGCNPFGCWLDTLVAVIDDDVRVVVNQVGPTPRASPTVSSTPRPCLGDGDDDGRVTIDELVAAVANALGGCPSPTVSPTPQTSHPAEIAEDVLEEIADQICQTDSTPGGAETVERVENGATLNCTSFTGHQGTVHLGGFPAGDAAADAFDTAVPDTASVELEGGLLRRRCLPADCSTEGHLTQDWAWLKGCWLVVGHSFDDTHFLLSPQPQPSVQAIVASARAAELFATCTTE